MIEESLIKSNFVGRDGFRWWIGQVPPISSQGQQANGGGWGNRVKVRIMGYHPWNDDDLSNEDLPWAQVLLPATAGTGAGNYATNIKIRPGDTVFGFFMDGDNAQIPVILGCFGRTSEVSDEQYSNPFEPFTGYTNNVKNDGSKLKTDQSNEQNKESQKSPRTIDPAKVKQLGADELSYFNAIGNKIISANSCKSTIAQSLMSELDNLVGRLKIPSIALDISSEIKRTVDKIQGMANGFVGQMFSNTFSSLIPILQNGLELLYAKIFSYVYAITPGDPSIKFAVAHAAGVLAQKALVSPVKEMEKQISCSASKTVNSLYDPIKQLIESYINNVENYTECSGIEFTAGLLNAIIDSMVSNVSPSLNGVTRILSPGFNLENLLRGSVSNYLNSGGGTLDCNQNRKKCSGLVGNFAVGSGNKGYRGNDLYQQILDTMNGGKKVGKAVIYDNELPDDILIKTNQKTNDARTTVITNNVNNNTTVIKLRDISIVKRGQFIVTKKESMSVVNVDYAKHRVTVSRTSNKNSYKPGTKVRIVDTVDLSPSGTSRNLTDFESLVGSFNVFNGKTKDRNSSCYTGPISNCTPPMIKFVGGGGFSGRARPLLGRYRMQKNGKMTASIIGVQIQNSGLGYRYPPYIQFYDNCNQGYGAIARTEVNSDGRIINSYMVSIGENYPISEIESYEVVNIIVDNGGSGYSSDIEITDDQENEYEVIIDNETGEILEVNPINITEVSDLPELIIKSETGSGAYLRPILGEIQYDDITIVSEPELQIPNLNDPIVVQLALSEQPIPELAPEITNVREKARLRRRLLQDNVNIVKDCPN